MADQPDSQAIWLWLEAVSTTTTPQTPASMGWMMQSLGRFNGGRPAHANQPLPDWLSRQALRRRIERLAQEGGPHGFANPTAWRDPRLQPLLPNAFEAALQTLWQPRNDWLDQLDALPQLLIHGDANPTNLLSPLPIASDQRPIALDWSTLGLAALGTDPADFFVWSLLGNRELAGSYTLTQAQADYRTGLTNAAYPYSQAALALGFDITAALMLAARLYWFINRALRSEADEAALATWQPITTVIMAFAERLARRP
jgi:hypothetical protein